MDYILTRILAFISIFIAVGVIIATNDFFIKKQGKSDKQAWLYTAIGTYVVLLAIDFLFVHGGKL